MGVSHKRYVPTRDLRKTGGDARVKDIGWGDSLLALLLAPLLVLPVIAAVYVVLFVVLDINGASLSYWFGATFIVTCVAEGFILAAFYEKKGYQVEYRWAWALVAPLIAAIVFAPYLVGIMTLETSLELTAWSYSSLAGYFLIVMLSLVISIRTNAPDRLERSKVDVQKEAMTVLLKR